MDGIRNKLGGAQNQNGEAILLGCRSLCIKDVIVRVENFLKDGEKGVVKPNFLQGDNMRSRGNGE